jgi:hypothetical protein
MPLTHIVGSLKLLEEKVVVSSAKPENQTTYYQEHPPACIADFLALPAWLDNIDFDGHGYSGSYPDGLVLNPNIVFAIKCQCGGGVHSIVAESQQEEIWYYKNLVIAERYSLECSSCHSQHLLFDKFLHGYNAEGSKVEGLSLSEIVETSQSPRKNEKITCKCSTCKRSTFEVFTRFEYPPDLFDEPSFEGKEQEFFSWFTGIGKCSTCSTINLFIDYECA